MLRTEVYEGAAQRGVATATRYVYSDNMTNEDNSVNIKSDGAKTTGAYHHGDLRAAVIAAGLKRLAEGDVTR